MNARQGATAPEPPSAVPPPPSPSSSRPVLPSEPGFWRSPLRGAWLTSVLGLVLLAGLTVVFVTGLLSYAAYNPGLSPVNDKTPEKGLLGFYLFAWPTDPHWLYRLTQGLHVVLGLALVPVVLAKLWSVVPRLFALPPVRSAAHALERLTLLMLVGGVLFQLATGVLNIQLDYLFPGSFYPLHFYGAWVFFAGFALHVCLKLPQVLATLRSGELRSGKRSRPTRGAGAALPGPGRTSVGVPGSAGTAPGAADGQRPSGASAEESAVGEPSVGEPAAEEPRSGSHAGPPPGGSHAERPTPADELTAPRPDPPTVGRRGVLGAVGIASLVVVATSIGQSLGGPLRVTALLAPHGGPGSEGDAGFPVNKTARGVGVTAGQRGEGWRLVLTGPDGTRRLDRSELLALPQHEAALPIACVEGWSTEDQLWSGVRLRDLARLAGYREDRMPDVFVESLQVRGAFRSAALRSNQVADPRSLLALRVNGADLTPDHGHPARVIVPAAPGVMNTKWVARLNFGRTL